MIVTKVQAVYYDGVSSKPHHIELFLDRKKNCLYFENEGKGWLNWSIHEVKLTSQSNLVSLHYNLDISQSIQITDQKFIKDFKQYLSDNRQLDWYQKAGKLNLGVLLSVAIVLFVFIIISYLYVVPWFGEKAAILLPESFDDELGKSAFHHFILTENKNQKESKLLQEFSDNLNLNNTKKLHLTVVNSPIVNAFALPDGNVVVYKRMLDKISTYEELAALIGHETAHINNRHSVKLLCRDLSGYLFLSAILGDINGIMSIIGQHADSLYSLSFSRNFEKESDEEGFKLMLANKINPRGMIKLFEALEEEEHQEGINVPEFLSSHPITQDRIKTIQKLISSKQYNFKKNKKLESIFNQLKQEDHSK
ncbi:M48 family metallopeptidase [Flavobacterium oreochromis]|uniref:M48 family metallopeptidase n=1 Tax=Flavobacterium oreochromis TaxID=2906078 RepID=UPI00385ECA67